MDKEKLKDLVNMRLQWNDLEIDDNELEEVIKLYDHYLDFLLEATNERRNSYHDRYGFLDSIKEVDIQYGKIFTDIAIIKKYNLECCLDYFRILNTLHGPIYNIVNSLYRFTNSLAGYLVGNNDFNNPHWINNTINHFWNDNERLVTVWLDEFIVECIMESTYIPDSYKEVINLYDKICKMLNQNKSLNGSGIPFERIINMSYYYFMIHNYFNTECDKVIIFLRYMYDKPSEIIDYINFAGITFRDELFDYFDYLYKGNVVNNKMIK